MGGRYPANRSPYRKRDRDRLGSANRVESREAMLVSNFGHYWLSACAFTYVFSYFWDVPRLRKAVILAGAAGWLAWQVWDWQSWYSAFAPLFDTKGREGT